MQIKLTLINNYSDGKDQYKNQDLDSDSRAVIVMSIIMNSCAQNQKIVAKSGPKLWVENCQRCNNTPSPTSFSHEQWVTVGMHMQTRAQLTDKEMDKIVKFLSQ